jgi:hypothetical protein
MTRGTGRAVARFERRGLVLRLAGLARLAVASSMPLGLALSVAIAVVPAGCSASNHVPVNGAATLSSGTADPCRGARFDADLPDPRCVHHSVGTQSPAPSGLRVAFASSPVARSGYDAGLVLEMTNDSRAPLALDVEETCGTFEAQASNPGSNSFESDCFGACGGGPEPHVLRVTLEPGGVVRKKVKFYAVQTRIQLNEREDCVTKTVGALPPGAYDLRVTLPWTDPIADDPTVTRPRVLTAQLTVTP